MFSFHPHLVCLQTSIMTVEKDKSDGITVGQPHLAKQVSSLVISSRALFYLECVLSCHLVTALWQSGPAFPE